MVASEQEFILASCCGSPMSRNAVLEELRVNKLADPGRYMLKSMLKMSNGEV